MIFALSAALFVSVLCALHATAGIVRGIRASLPEGYDKFSNNNNSSSSSSATGSYSAKKQQQLPPSLSRRDSVYGGSRKSRIIKDLILLLGIILTIVGLTLTRPRNGRVVPICMMVGLALLFTYKPLRALREAQEEFVGQLILIQMLVRILWAPKCKIGKKGKHASGSVYDNDDIFDERDLSAATSAEALAAEVIRLRRKVVQLEDKIEGATGSGQQG